MRSCTLHCNRDKQKAGIEKVSAKSYTIIYPISFIAMSSGQQSRLSSSLLVDQHQRTIIRQLLRNTKNIETQLDIIVKEFTKPSEKTNVERLMGVLEAISRNQPEAREAYSEVKNNVYNMEPFEMLDTFLNTYQFRCEVRRSREFTTAPPDAADGNNEGLIYTFNTNIYRLLILIMMSHHFRIVVH